MNYNKLDSPLLAALEDIQDPEEPNLLVFIIPAWPPGPEDRAALQEMGLDQEVGTKRIVSAALSATMVAEFSEMEWVRALRLSQKLRLLPDAGETASGRDWRGQAPIQEDLGPKQEVEAGEEGGQGLPGEAGPEAESTGSGRDLAGCASDLEEPPEDTTATES